MATSKEIFDSVEGLDFDGAIAFAREQADIMDNYLSRKYNDDERKVNQVYFTYFINCVCKAAGVRPNSHYCDYLVATTGYDIDEQLMYNIIDNIEEDGNYDDFEEDMEDDVDFSLSAVCYMAVCSFLVEGRVVYGVRQYLDKYFAPSDRCYQGGGAYSSGQTYSDDYSATPARTGYAPGGSFVLGFILGFLLSWIGLIISAVLKKKKTLTGGIVGFITEIVAAVIFYFIANKLK